MKEFLLKNKKIIILYETCLYNNLDIFSATDKKALLNKNSIFKRTDEKLLKKFLKNNE